MKGKIPSWKVQSFCWEHFCTYRLAGGWSRWSPVIFLRGNSRSLGIRNVKRKFPLYWWWGDKQNLDIRSSSLGSVSLCFLRNTSSREALSTGAALSVGCHQMLGKPSRSASLKPSYCSQLSHLVEFWALFQKCARDHCCVGDGRMKSAHYAVQKFMDLGSLGWLAVIAQARGDWWGPWEGRSTQGLECVSRNPGWESASPGEPWSWFPEIPGVGPGIWWFLKIPGRSKVSKIVAPQLSWEELRLWDTWISILALPLHSCVTVASTSLVPWMSRRRNQKKGGREREIRRDFLSSVPSQRTLGWRQGLLQMITSHRLRCTPCHGYGREQPLSLGSISRAPSSRVIAKGAEMVLLCREQSKSLQKVMEGFSQPPHKVVIRGTPLQRKKQVHWEVK